MEKLLRLDDISLIPSRYNYGDEISEINIQVEEPDDISVGKSLPIFTSPLSVLVGLRNWSFWQDSGIRTIIPSTESIEERLNLCMYVFCIFTIEEIERYFLGNVTLDSRTQYRIAFDTPNGLDAKWMDIGGKLKSRYGQQVLIMGGPVFNAVGFEYHTQLNFDFVRVGFNSEVAVRSRESHAFNYPLASLLISIKNYKITKMSNIKKFPRIIAEGNELVGYYDMVKAIALGADYVMVGQGLSNVIEANSPIFQKDILDNDDIEYIPVNIENYDIDRIGEISKTNNWVRFFYTDPEIMERISDCNYSSFNQWRTSGGSRQGNFYGGLEMVDVDITLELWIEKFCNSLRYAFSMFGARDWNEFRSNIRYGYF